MNTFTVYKDSYYLLLQEYRIKHCLQILFDGYLFLQYYYSNTVAIATSTDLR